MQAAQEVRCLTLVHALRYADRTDGGTVSFVQDVHQTLPRACCARDVQIVQAVKAVLLVQSVLPELFSDSFFIVSGTALVRKLIFRRDCQLEDLHRNEARRSTG